MNQQISHPADPPKNVYAAVYRSLVIGMTTSTILFAAGVVLALVRTHGAPLTVDPKHVFTFGHVIDGLLRLDPIALMTVATAAMILTPISRVVASLVAFLVDRDYTFALITGLVLAAIVCTIVLGAFGVRV